MITDDPIRDLERQLIAAAASESTAATAPPKWVRRLPTSHPPRWLAGAGLAGVLCVVALAGTFGGSGTPSGVSILRTAAAVAAEQPAETSGYRYTEVIDRQTYTAGQGDRHAAVTLEQPSEQWVNRDGKGRQVFQSSRVVSRSGDPGLQDALPLGLQEAGSQPYPPSGSVRPAGLLKDLPTDADALLQTLTDGYRNGRISTDGSRPSQTRERYQVTAFILMLLSDANVTADQRAALFGALSRMPAVTSLGTITDPTGRSGQGVAIKTTAADPLPSARFTVIFDPATSALLSWTVATEIAPGSDPALTERSHIVTRAGQVDALDTRP